MVALTLPIWLIFAVLSPIFLIIFFMVGVGFSSAVVKADKPVIIHRHMS
jgi:hypothetical protein